MKRQAFSVTLFTLAAVCLGWGLHRSLSSTSSAAPELNPIPRGERSVLLVTVDTTRPDRLEPYGAENVETPYLARLARQGVVFERAYSVAPITLVAHTSILSGLAPHRHGVRNNGLHSVPEEVETLAETLQAEGYATAAFVSAAVLEGRYNLGQGFDVYDDDLSKGRERHPRMVADRPAEVTVASARRWLDSMPDDRPYFLWVHLYDPHAAYSPPPPWRDKYRDRLYDGEIAYMDHEIGRLLAHPRVDEEAVVTVLGDHGESLGEHGEQTHALLAYDSTLHVPWILRVPGGPRGFRPQQAVGQVDLVPTLLDLLGLSTPEGLDGASLIPLLESPGKLVERSLYSETFLPFYTYGWAKLRVLRKGRYKWIDGPDPELYDTRRDPHELSDLSEQHPGEAHDMARDLRELLEASAGAGGDGGGDGGGGDREASLALDDEARERLRSLGYLATGSSTGRRPAAQQPAPKAMIDLHVGLERARFFVRDRLFDLAESELRGVLRRDSGNLAALTDLAAVLGEQDEMDEAVRVLERALSLDPTYVRLHLQLADIEGRRSGAQRALEILDGALALDPGSLDARLRKSGQLLRLQQPEEARKVLEEALELYPDSAHAHALYGRAVELRRGDFAAAEERARHSLERDPFLVAAWQLLGESQERQGDLEQAASSYRFGLKRQPDDTELHARLGMLLARRHDGSDAGVHLREALRLSHKPRTEVRVALGAWLAEQGRFREAEQQYEKALVSQPDHPGALNNRAIAFYRTGRLDEAERELLSLVEHHPDHADAHNNLAAIAIDRGRYDLAEQRAHRALALAPAAESWNNLGLAKYHQNQLREARRAYEKALEIAPDYWQSRLNLGLLQSRAGDPEGAAGTLQQLIQQIPRLPDAHLELGRLYAGPLDQPKEARTHFNAFLRQAPDRPEADEVRQKLADLGA